MDCSGRRPLLPQSVQLTVGSKYRGHSRGVGSSCVCWQCKTFACTVLRMHETMTHAGLTYELWYGDDGVEIIQWDNRVYLPVPVVEWLMGNFQSPPIIEPSSWDWAAALYVTGHMGWEVEVDSLSPELRITAHCGYDQETFTSAAEFVAWAKALRD